jgi:Zn-dependent metalloprotease
MEVKILTAFRQVLTGDQYSILEKAIKAPPELRRAIYSARGSNSLPGVLLRLEEQPATTDALANQVYDNIGIVHEFFRTVFDRNINSDVHGPLVATVHYGTKFNNVFWNGQQIVVGDGDGVVFKTDGLGSLGAVATQLGHLVVQYSAGLTFQGQSGSLNSHFSDLFSVLTEQWRKKQSVETASWLVGKEFLGPNIKGVALRSMKAPGTAYDDPRLGKDQQPNDMKDFVSTDADNGGVHINSGIPNRAFYEVARLIGGYAWEKPGNIWYKSLLKVKNPNVTFSEFAQTTYEVAGALYGAGGLEQEAVKKGWQLVGITVVSG